MNTHTSKQVEENINTASKWFSESANAITDIYTKQLKLGYDLWSSSMSLFINPFMGKAITTNDSQKVADTFLNMYNFQLKQFAETNKRFIEAISQLEKEKEKEKVHLDSEEKRKPSK